MIRLRFSSGQGAARGRISAMVVAREGFDPLTEEDIKSVCHVTLIAGRDTVMDTMWGATVGTRDISLSSLAGLVGQELGVSPWMEVSQQLIEQFADVTGDHHWMHVDVQRATRELGGPIAHGLLTLCLLPKLGNEIARVAGYRRGFSYGFEGVRFVRPVAAGSRIRLRQNLQGVERKGEGQLVRISCVIEVEGSDKPALVADHLSVYYDS